VNAREDSWRVELVRLAGAFRAGSRGLQPLGEDGNGKADEPLPLIAQRYRLETRSGHRWLSGARSRNSRMVLATAS
jgi:hypothetical protein